MTSPRLSLRAPRFAKDGILIAEKPIWDFSVVRATADAVSEGLPAPVVARRAGVSLDQVLDLVAELGTWVSRVVGPAHPTLPYLDGYRGTPPSRRDVGRAAAVLAAHRPDDSLLARFVNRRTGSVSSSPTAADLQTLVLLDRVGRLDDLGAVRMPRPAAARFLRVWSLVSLAVAEADAALRELCREGVGCAEAARAAASARWVDEAAMLRIMRAAGIGESGSLRREIRAFRARAVRGEFDVSRLADLGDGQVLRLAEALGLPGDGPGSCRAGGPHRAA